MTEQIACGVTMSAKVTPLIASLVRTYYCGANKELVRLARVPAGTSMAPTRFTSGALITRNNFDALDGGFPGPRPRGRTSGRHTRAGFSFWRNDMPLAVSLGRPLSLLRTA